MQSNIYNLDCLPEMRNMPDNCFNLAIVDPPYGIGFSDYERGSSGIKIKERFTKTGKKQWDSNTPTKEYFDQLFRVSKNQIIWGSNYFNLPPTQCFIFWYKQNPVPNFADGELAWTSFKRPAMCFNYRYYGNLEGETNNTTEKKHPTQKPVSLYKWILKNYAKPGDKILDTHGGSMSSVIACLDGGFNIDCYEIDKEYFEAAKVRIENHLKQTNLFSEVPKINFHNNTKHKK